MRSGHTSSDGFGEDGEYSDLQARWRESRLANRRGIQLARAEKPHEACQPASQCRRKGLIKAVSLILQPQAQDDERVGRPVEFAVEARDQPVAPQYRQRVVAEPTLVLRLVDLPDVVHAEPHFASPPRPSLLHR